MATDETSYVKAFDAQGQFLELLARVATGEEITITSHGSPVARLVPVGRKYTPDDRRDAIAAMRKLASQQRLDGISLRDLITEGRR